MYLTASKYIVRKGTSSKSLFEFDELLDDVDMIFSEIHKSKYIPLDFNEFVALLKSLRIDSIDDDGVKPLTSDYFTSHLLGDVTGDDNTKYFYIHNTWYKINDNFIKNLEENCSNFINNNFNNLLKEVWDFNNEIENIYNSKYIGYDKTIVMDKVTYENIELCDIMKWDDEYLYLYHIKAGFGNKMRDLCSQLLISAHRISRDLNDSKEYITNMYSSLRNKIGGDSYFDKVGKQTDIYSEDDFLNLFNNRKIVFVLAVFDTATNRTRSIKEIDKFDSNIAKFSLYNLIKEMKGIDMKFEITQIASNTINQ